MSMARARKGPGPSSLRAGAARVGPDPAGLTVIEADGTVRYQRGIVSSQPFAHGRLLRPHQTP
jgi:hypothetical protein